MDQVVPHKSVCLRNEQLGTIFCGKRVLKICLSKQQSFQRKKSLEVLRYSQLSHRSSEQVPCSHLWNKTGIFLWCSSRRMSYEMLESARSYLLGSEHTRISRVLCFRHIILDSKVSPFMLLIKYYLLLVDHIYPYIIQLVESLWNSLEEWNGKKSSFFHATITNHKKILQPLHVHNGQLKSSSPEKSWYETTMAALLLFERRKR